MLREPLAGAALALAAAVLALATCAAPLYEEAVGNAAFADAADGFHAEGLGLHVGTFAPMDEQGFAAVDAVVRERAAALDLDAPLVSIYGEAGAGRDGNPPPVQLFGRADALDHLPEPRPCASDEPGVWIPASLAAATDTAPCGTLTLTTRRQGERPGAAWEHEYPVAGVYRDLHEVLDTPIWRAPDPVPATDPIATFWGRRAQMVVRPSPTGEPTPQPPIVVAEPEVLVSDVDQSMFGPMLDQTWLFPAPTGEATIAEARAASEAFAALALEARNVQEPLGEAVAGLGFGLGVRGAFARTLLPDVVEQADTTVAGVSAAMQPLGLAGQVGALVVLAAAGLFEARRRRSERLLLATQGVPPVSTAARTVLEGLLPLALGTLAGAAAAVTVVSWLAPGAPPGADALVAVAADALLWAGVGIALLAASGAMATAVPVAGSEADGEPGSDQAAQGSAWLRRLAASPWEVLPLLLAAASWWTLSQRGEVLLSLDGADGGPTIDASYVLFPLLLLVASAGLAARLVPHTGRALRRLTARSGPAPYLAARRLAEGPGTAGMLVAATALGIGVLVYAATLGTSTQRSADTSVALVAGAPSTVALPPSAEPPDLPFPSTIVARDRATLRPSGRDVDLLAVDPATFAEVAEWPAHLHDDDLATLLERLAPGDDDALPALLVGAGDAEQPALETDRYRLPLRVVGRPDGFPGISGDSPLVVVSHPALVEQANAAGGSTIDEALMLSRLRELWARADAEELSTRLGADFPVEHVRTLRELARQPRLAAATWAFGYLQAVGVAAALLALAAVVLYLHGRQRSRDVSYVLTRRMGLRRASNRRAAVLELAVLLGVALLAGALPGVLAAALVLVTVQTLPSVGPPPLLVVPWPVLGAVVGLTASACLAAGWLTQRVADRARPAAVLRAAD